MYDRIKMFGIKGLLSLVLVGMLIVTASASDISGEYVSRGEVAGLFHEMMEGILPTFSSEYSIMYEDLSPESPYYQVIVKNMCGKSPMLAWGMKAQFAS